MPLENVPVTQAHTDKHRPFYGAPNSLLTRHQSTGHKLTISQSETRTQRSVGVRSVYVDLIRLLANENTESTSASRGTFSRARESTC